MKDVHKRLSHLSKDQINDLMDRYYNGESAKKLITEFGIKVSSSQLYSTFPPEEFEDYICDSCNTILVRDRSSKSLKDAPKYERELYCPECGHKQYDNTCRCNYCLDKQEKLRNERILLIKKTYGQNIEPVAFEDLNFQCKIYLGALCRALLSENLNEIHPNVSIQPPNPPVCPTNDMTHELYNILLKHKAIRVSPISPLEAFPFDDDFPNTVYTYKAIYELNLEPTNNKEQLVFEILNPSYYDPSLSEEAYRIWVEIAMEECKQYLLNQLNKVGFDFTPGEKTLTVFKSLLADYSVSQIYGIIWKCVADASKLYLETRMSKQHAANTVIGACERYGERAKQNNWDLKKYSRLKDLPQTSISAFFFNKVLNIGQMGFDMPPTAP